MCDKFTCVTWLIHLYDRTDDLFICVTWLIRTCGRSSAWRNFCLKMVLLSLLWLALVMCVAVCCSVLQYVAVCCSVLQCVLQWLLSLLWLALVMCVAVCCSMLQYVAVCCSMLQWLSCTHIWPCQNICLWATRMTWPWDLFWVMSQTTSKSCCNALKL